MMNRKSSILLFYSRATVATTLKRMMHTNCGLQLHFIHCISHRLTYSQHDGGVISVCHSNILAANIKQLTVRQVCCGFLHAPVRCAQCSSLLVARQSYCLLRSKHVSAMRDCACVYRWKIGLFEKSFPVFRQFVMHSVWSKYFFIFLL